MLFSSRDSFSGEAWLGVRVAGTHPTRIEQEGSLRTKGLVGMASWWLLWPVHLLAFRSMVRHRVVPAASPAASPGAWPGRRAVNSEWRRPPVPGAVGQWSR
ncbi:MAG: hypothetical protein ACLQPH_15330 [Acidimicrobiales bacterium]